MFLSIPPPCSASRSVASSFSSAAPPAAAAAMAASRLSLPCWEADRDSATGGLAASTAELGGLSCASWALADSAASSSSQHASAIFLQGEEPH